MQVTTVTYVASTLSGLALLACLFALINISGDVKDLWEELDNSMLKFRTETDDMWHDIVKASRKKREAYQGYESQPAASSDSQPPGTNVFAQAPGGPSPPPSCACDTEKQKRCPRGPPGPKGSPGSPGPNGLNGLDGKAGHDSEDVAPAYHDGGQCFNCPPGPPGPPGPVGAGGHRGMKGEDGRPGRAGRDGHPGLPGQMGPMGQQGRIGPPGPTGEKGADGRAPIGRPGHKGLRGPPGEVGPVGHAGKDGPTGEPGEGGPQGPEGKQGPKGIDGPPGAEGHDGRVGRDAEYCPCPQRGSGGSTAHYLACAGADTPKLRVYLIAVTFISGGIASILQSTFGLRLAIIHGSSLAFLPPLLAWSNLPENKCTANSTTIVPEEFWKTRLLTVSGSLLISSFVFIIIGFIGAVGWFSKHVGPITIVPLMSLLALSTVPTLERQLGMHWISLIELCLLLLFAVRLEHFQVPIPYYSFKEKTIETARAPLFGQFPYLLAIGISWFICWMLSSFELIDRQSPISTNRKITEGLVAQAPWVNVPYPGELGSPKISTALCVGFCASALSAMIESVGSYKMSARVSQQGSPPRNNVNRAVIVEGIGSLIAASLNLAGVLSVCYGLFTKFAAVLACIPDPLIGGMLCLGMSMIAGVALSNLRVVNLLLTRNLAIMGFALLAGMVVPLHFENHPIDTGNQTLDQVLNMLLSIKMLVGGLLAFSLDNLMPGATRADRGLIDEAEADGPTDGCGTWVQNGFCSNSAYTDEQKAQYCPSSCNLCDGAGTTAGSTAETSAGTTAAAGDTSAGTTAGGAATTTAGGAAATTTCSQ
ncbi:unnamed protein product, partial [Mesorhabditis spiculigera]